MNIILTVSLILTSVAIRKTVQLCGHEKQQTKFKTCLLTTHAVCILMFAINMGLYVGNFVSKESFLHVLLGGFIFGRNFSVLLLTNVFISSFVLLHRSVKRSNTAQKIFNQTTQLFLFLFFTSF